MGLQRWDPSFEIEELEVDRGVQRLVDHLGTHEDETLYMYKITRPTVLPASRPRRMILELAAG